MLPWRAQSPPPAEPRWDALLWDGMAQYYPWRTFAARLARRGLIPLWNPHQFCGTPFVANGQSAFFYPPNCLFYVMDVRYAFGLSAALHYLLAGCFVLLLARELGLRAVSGLVGALAFVLGGFIVSWTALPTLMDAACWLPGVAWSIERAFRRREPLGGLLVAFTLAMCLLAGHLQIAAYVWLTAGFHLASRSLWALYRRDLRPVLPAMAAIPLAVSLASVQLLPTLELARRSPRGAVSPDENGFQFRRARALQPVMLATFLAPDALGPPDRWSAAGLAYSETCGYVGKLTLLLALCAFFGDRSRRALWFALIAALALLGAMGTPVARLLYFHVPGMAQAGGFGRLLCVYTFAVAVLAALGVDWLTSRLSAERSPRLARAFAPGLPLAVALVVGLEVGVWAREFLPLSPRDQVYPPTTLTSTLAADSGRWRVLGVTPRENWIIHRRPEALLPPNSATAYGYDSVQGYDSLFPAIYEQLAARANPQGFSPLANGNMVLLDNPFSEALDAAAVRWLVLPQYAIPPGGRYVERRRTLGTVVYENLAARPRVRSRAGETPPQLQATGDPCRVVANLAGSASTRVTVADTFYPGWHAYVDGREVPIDLEAPSFRVVAVSREAQRIEMVYRPASFAFGAFLSLTALAVGAAWIASVRGRKEPHRSVEQTGAGQTPG